MILFLVERDKQFEVKYGKGLIKLIEDEDFFFVVPLNLGSNNQFLFNVVWESFFLLCRLV